MQVTVAGVVNDIVYGDMYGRPDPILYMCTSPRFENTMYVRIKPNTNSRKILAPMETIMKKYNPLYPFEYRFVSDQFNDMFYNETLVSKLSRVFASLAVLISCLGLFGLAAYTAERRTKEIGVRRVLGASISGVAALLSRDFLRLVMLASLIAFPIAWWLMNHWLQDYQYRISISFWIFVIAGALAFLIAVITISSQAIRAAMANPAKSLRSE
jgi:putative ABC transport system permease protein